jgi:hypothetical protein
LNTYNAPGLLEGGSEFTVAVAALPAVLELQAARKASRLNAPTPSRADRCKKLLRLEEDPKKDDPKSGFVPIKELPSRISLSRPTVAARDRKKQG